MTAKKGGILQFVLGIFFLHALTAQASFGPDESSSAAEGNPGPKQVFRNEVYPILQKYCFECHGDRRQEADFRIDQPASLLASDRVVPGSAEHSQLLHRIGMPEGSDLRMPPVGPGPVAAERRALTQWIEAGAFVPQDFKPGRHWAYQAPVRPQIDVAQNVSAIDQLVRRRLQQRGLQPAARATPQNLVRRLSLDLIGLPPEPELVESYEQSPDEQNYRRIVDQLLSSPEFGVRWSRHWLDLARYADSHGFQRDDLRDLWAYRDWVVNALNQDMPYDQFSIEQLAGDLLPEPTESQQIATGFHRCVPTNVEAGSLPEETRAEQLIDRVNTTAAVWMGTTLECAQCHDHKYDPFSQRDYYRLLAFFNTTELEADRKNPKQPSSIAFLGPSMTISEPVRDAQRQKKEAQAAELKAERKQFREQLEAALPDLVSSRLKEVEKANKKTSETILQVLEFSSQDTGTKWDRLEDGSILLSGDSVPEVDLYRVRVAANLRDVRAIRLEALSHDSLPGNGPGRGEVERPNFVLHELTLKHFIGGRNGQPVKFRSARSSFAQQNWDAVGAIDGIAKTGWAIAPRFGESHQATFLLQQPLHTEPDDVLEFELDQHLGGGRLLGRFRLVALSGPVKEEDDDGGNSEAFLAALRKSPRQWKTQDRNALLQQFEKEDQRFEKIDVALTRVEQELKSLAPRTTLVMIESEPRSANIFLRGDYREKGAEVTPGVPEVFGVPSVSPQTRLDLARWLVSPANPLAARAAVNRWWAELFGEGLVATPEDFGLKGDRPEHAELLDWLAVELMQNGWSMKQLLREIVLSETYRQTSVISPQAAAVDSRNRWLARSSSFRMDAEMIRDNMLAISGLLNRQQGGPPIYPVQPDGLWKKVGGTQYDYSPSEGAEQYRRSLYIVLKRSAMFPGLMTFDGSVRQSCTVQRARTNTPMQALMLLNDEVSLQAASAFAKLLLETLPAGDSAQWIRLGFRRCTGRLPSVREMELLTELFVSRRRALQSGETGNSADGDRSIRKALESVCLVLLNLHETITRP